MSVVVHYEKAWAEIIRPEPGMEGDTINKYDEIENRSYRLFSRTNCSWDDFFSFICLLLFSWSSINCLSPMLQIGYDYLTNLKDLHG